MPPITIYDASIALYIRGMSTLLNILSKTLESPGADSFLSTRLYDDMEPLSFQIKMVIDTAKTAIEHLTGEPQEVWEDNEKTMPELMMRIEKTLALLKSVDAKSVEGVEDRKVKILLGRARTAQVHASGFVLGQSVPNFFFHISTAYGILRSKGVPLGKRDYLRPFLSPFISEIIE